jgi:hypothetical protein
MLVPKNACGRCRKRAERMKDDRTIGRMFANDIRLEYADCALELPQVLLTVG